MGSLEPLGSDLPYEAGEPAAALRSLFGALAAGGSPAHRVQLLEAQLADADRSARRSVVRERAIEDALLDAQHRVADLELQLRQLESAEVLDRFGASLVPGAYEDPLDSLDALRKERDELRYQVADLSEELKDAHARRIRAERRCNELERQLVMAEQGARADVESQDRQEDRQEERREPSGKSACGRPGWRRWRKSCDGYGRG
ncbi:hypothetical protein [Streptomyces sp. NPDC101150]|uniref:hypothetical protein n=1 Tax=Streptomyces sp. NPDC101150 TaxID=3366114 RepID=UPI003830E338